MDYQPVSSTQEEEVVVQKPHGLRSSVEILMFTFYFAKTLADTVITNLVEQSTCVVVLNYDLPNCTEPVSPTIEGQLQQSAANLLMARSVIDAFVPSLLVVFIGPWSDSNGRRPIFLLTFAGYTISTGIWCVLSLIPDMNPTYFLLTSVPVALTGGYISFFLALYCYISDITEPDKRAMRMSLLTFGLLAGVLLSTLVTPYILKLSTKYGFTIVFAISTGLQLFTLILTYFLVPESINIVESRRTSLWNFGHVKEIFRTCFRPRENHVRSIVIFIIINLGLFILIMDGEMAVLYMYAQKEFNWKLVDFSRFTSFVIVIAGMSLVCSTWLFSNVLKIPDLPLMFIGTLSILCKAVVQVFSPSPMYLYIGGVFTILSVLIPPLSRSQISKLIPPEDLGKIFAFTAFVEAVAPLAASPLYITVYKKTMYFLPTTFFWMSAGLSVVSVFTIGSAYFLLRRSSVSSYSLLSEQTEGDSKTNSIQS